MNKKLKLKEINIHLNNKVNYKLKFDYQLARKYLTIATVLLEKVGQLLNIILSW